jgi:tyrosine-protein phosphatase non-receptor type 12/18/22
MSEYIPQITFGLERL